MPVRTYSSIFRANQPIHPVGCEHDVVRLAWRKGAAKIEQTYPGDVAGEIRTCDWHFCIPLRLTRPGPLSRSPYLPVLTVWNQDWKRSSRTVLSPDVKSYGYRLRWLVDQSLHKEFSKLTGWVFHAAYWQNERRGQKHEYHRCWRRHSLPREERFFTKTAWWWACIKINKESRDDRCWQWYRTDVPTHIDSWRRCQECWSQFEFNLQQ